MSAIARIGYASYLNHTTPHRGVSDLHHDQIMEKDIPYETLFGLYSGSPVESFPGLRSASLSEGAFVWLMF